MQDREVPRPLMDTQKALNFNYFNPVSRSIDLESTEDAEFMVTRGYSLPTEREGFSHKNSDIGLYSAKESPRTAKMVAERIYPGGFIRTEKVSQTSN